MNTRNYEGCTALGETIKFGHLETIKALLNAGVLLSEENVLLAAKAGHIHLMFELAARNVRFSHEVIAHLSTKWIQLQNSADPLASVFEGFLTKQYQI